jgi:uncharacterized surface protein with fasciclin (FAS1) repeats
MHLNRLLATAAVAALTLCPAAALAQPGPTATAPAEAVAPAAAPAPAAASAPAAAPTLPPSPNLMANGNLVSTLKASGKFTILVKAIEATNLAATLSTAPNLTLFAPTDDAFRALPAGQLDRLMMPANANLLQKVVIYHLVNLPLDSSKIRGAKGPVKTVENGEIQIDGGNEVLMVNNADIIQADVHATNGYIHVIDKVLIPADAPLAAASAAQAPTQGS